MVDVNQTQTPQQKAAAMASGRGMPPPMPGMMDMQAQQRQGQQANRAAQGPIYSAAQGFGQAAAANPGLDMSTFLSATLPQGSRLNQSDVGYGNLQAGLGTTTDPMAQNAPPGYGEMPPGLQQGGPVGYGGAADYAQRTSMGAMGNPPPTMAGMQSLMQPQSHEMNPMSSLFAKLNGQNQPPLMNRLLQ